MNILILWQSKYPWDVRIDKFIRSLSKLGNKVFVLARSTDNGNAVCYYLDAKVYQIKPISRISLVNSVVTQPIPFNYIWDTNLNNIIVNEDIDLIIVRDIPLALTAYNIGNRNKIPVWLDMAEDYPATFKEMDRNIFEKLFIKNYLLARYYEKYVIKRMDHISVVVEESKNRLVAMGTDEKKVSIISNTPDKYFVSQKIDSNIVDFYRGKFVLLYHGNLGKKRGIERILDVINRIKDRIPNILLLVLGGNQKDIIEICSYANNLGVGHMVEFKGKVEYYELPSYISACEIGIIPHIMCEHTESTIPNKLFDYMALKKPILSSNVTPIKRIIDQSNAGEVFKWNDIDDLENKLLLLIDDKNKRILYGENGHKAYMEKYNWEQDELVVAGILNKLVR